MSEVLDDRAVVDKAVSLLMAFGAQGSSGVGVSELARRSGLSKSTAFRVLGMLVRNGVVERAGRGYRLGARLHSLGQAVYAPDHDRIRDVLIPYLLDLYEQTHETVHLAALHGTDVLYLAKLYGHRQMLLPSRIYGRVPAYATGVGKAMLAYDPDALDLTLTQRLTPFTPRTICDPDRLREVLDDVRRTGIAVDDEEIAAGVACLAMPVLGPGGRPIAALSVSVPTGRLDRAAMEPVLRRVVAAAARAVR